LEKRIAEHVINGGCRLLDNAISKYGIENFKIEILKECNFEELDLFEQLYISTFNSMHPNGYNIRAGGSFNSLHCEESRQKMRERKIGENNHNYGKPRSDEVKLKISEAKSGEKHHFFGKKLSNDHKEKVAKAHRINETYKDLPMYVVHVKARPSHYVSEGYAVVNHPFLASKYFTSKNLSLSEKLNLALEYLNSFKECCSQTK
jgi:group I intron endonuclease